MINEESLKEFAWNWETCEDARGRTILKANLHRDGYNGFVAEYERLHNCELEQVQTYSMVYTEFQINYNEDED